MYRLGVIATGRIADRMVKTGLGGLDVECICVYNPHIESAERFASDNHIGRYTDSLDELVSCIDIAYVASPHETHAEYCEYLLNHDVSVLCEKPMTLDAQQAEGLYRLAKSRGLVLMEAVKTAYCQGFADIVRQAESGKIGRIVDVEAAFTRITSRNLREYTAPCYNGSMLELGSYGLLPVFRLLGTDYSDVEFKAVRNLNGVDIYSKAQFTYYGAMATVKCGIGAKSEGQLLVTGTKGYIIVPSPWWLTKYYEIRYEDTGRIERFETEYEGSGLQYEMKAFIERVRSVSGGKCDASMYNNDTKNIYAQERTGLTEKESISMAGVMEKFFKWNKSRQEQARARLKSDNERLGSPAIWAHRGCSYKYPENTLMAFEAAAELKGITGIELDVQYTKDKKVVVFHDENVARVTDGDKNVCEYTLDELKKLHISAGRDKDGNALYTQIPTLEEVFELLKPYCETNGLMINIELKTSRIRYEGIEQDTYDIVAKYGLKDYIVYSSFLADSVALMKQIDSDVKTGMLAADIEDAIIMARKTGADALHPAIGSVELGLPKDFAGCTVRAWGFGEPFFVDGKSFTGEDIRKYRSYGVTDVITNVPERYLP